MSKPVIGINADYRPARKEANPLAWSNAGYFDSVAAAGGVPTLLPPIAEKDDVREILSRLDGLVLTGCKFDLNPKDLGFDPHPATKAMPARREQFDRTLAQLAAEMRIPTLAIGAGMQTLNVLCGGTLFQHIGEDILKPLHHRDPVEGIMRHIIDIVPGTRMWDIYGPGEIRVNSDHHMAIDSLANCFRVSAAAPDGVIESYESVEDDWFCLGVQWHPESGTASALDMQVFECFLEGCRQITAEEQAPATVPFKQAA